MTGFGKAVVQLPSKKITIEVKSLNSKNLDLNARTPSAFREKELESIIPDNVSIIKSLLK